MKNNNKIILLIISCLFIGITPINAQKKQNDVPKDTLLYLNGEKEIVSNYQFSDDGLNLTYLNKKGKKREVAIDYLFAIINADGNRQIVYDPSNNEEDTLSIEDMSFFVQGGVKARKYHKARIACAEGFVIGVASPFVVLSTIGNPFYTPILPTINSVIIGLTTPSEKKIKKQYPQLAKNKLFIEGYKEAGRQKRVKHSIFGGIGGMLTGILIIAIL